MALTNSEVLASLDGVSSPEGLPLPKTGVLSDILVADGKVFFSITVTAAVVQAWEPVRKRAESAAGAVPHVALAHGDHAGGSRGGPPPTPPHQPPPSPPRVRNSPARS